MKIKMTADQLKRVLAHPDTKAKFPIIFDLKKVSKNELKELVKLIKRKKG